MLEHPAFLDRHDELDAPSIWRLQFFARLEALSYCKRHMVYQGLLGAISWKPTNFFGVHMPDFDDTVASYAVQPSPGQLVTLVGKDSSSAFKTAAAKEYPPQMCRCIAETACKRICRMQKTQKAPDHELLRQLKAFYVTLQSDRGGDFGADFWDDAGANNDVFTYRLSPQL